MKTSTFKSFGAAFVAAALLCPAFITLSTQAATCPFPSSQDTLGIPSPINFSITFNNGYVSPSSGITYPNGGSYVKVTLQPSGAFPGGQYLGWCADSAADINVNVPYSATIFDSRFLMCPDPITDPACVPYTILQPDFAFDPDPCVWNQINYLLNHKIGNADSVQAAMWDLISPADAYSMSTILNVNEADRAAMVAAAQANSDFIPGPTDQRAAVLYVNDNIQNVLIEVTPLPCTGQIGDFVWNDLNGNGCQDADEPGISNVVVNLSSGCSPDGVSFIKTTTTDADGKYLFTDLCAGTYTVSFITPNGFNRTLANQACNLGGKPSDETDSDCDCSGGSDCGICVVLPTDSSVDLTIDCGYVGSEPCITLTKEAGSPTALPGSEMTYTYTVTNCGGTSFSNIAIIDDNGSPGDTTDDFTVASGINLAPGETKSYTATVILPIPLCVGTGSASSSAGKLDVQILPSGDIKVTLTQSRNLNDNVYGTPAPAAGWTKGHTFGNLTGSDKAEFRFEDGTGQVVLDFYLDYISQAGSKVFPSGTVNYPSGYGTLGANGGDGKMIKGAVSDVLFASSSLTENLNSGLNGGFPSPYLVNSPSPEESFPNWNYLNSYTVIVSKNAFGAAGFGGVSIPDIHNSPAKTGDNQVTPTPCAGCVTNIASVVSVVGGNIDAILGTDNAVVCVDSPQPPTPACLITPGTLKIDKKTVQLPIKNNGTADIFLSEVAVAWNQSINGNLVKMSLNGDFWTGSAASGTTLNSGFNSDANRRKIAKGQTKTLKLTFANNASKSVSDYSGFINFGSDDSCKIAFPPPAPPKAFSCDGHIATLQMRWNGAENIKVIAHYGTASSTVLAAIDNVAPGDVVTVGDYTGSPNDVIWEIFEAGTNTKIGESQFHTSCSDSTMNGPEDCGSAQGNGKGNIATYINTWQFVGLTTIKGTTLTCP